MTHVRHAVLRSLVRLEPFPHVAVRVLELVMNDAPAAEIAAVVQGDPGLTAKVIATVNSAAYRPVEPITTIKDATVRLGSAHVANIALAAGAATFFMGYGGSSSRSNAVRWEECTHVASFARALAAETRAFHPELAFTIGLLQNVAHVVLDRFLEEHRDAVKLQVEDGAPLLVAERTELGLDHAQCGARLARRWSFPSELTDAIRDHHAVDGASAFPAIGVLAESLAAACVEDDGTSLLESDASEAQARLGLDDERIAHVVGAVRDELSGSQPE
ncbi:MAG: HDOD domain-containing protein [Planctomycetota bacterium]